jgi:hypothetical protein
MADAGNAGGWNAGRPRAAAAANGVAAVPNAGAQPGAVAGCARAPVHQVTVTVKWADDRTPVSALACRFLKGTSVVHPGPLANGTMNKTALPGGAYEVALPEVDAEEWDAE